LLDLRATCSGYLSMAKGRYTEFLVSSKFSSKSRGLCSHRAVAILCIAMQF
jgi:hypothetical protein